MSAAPSWSSNEYWDLFSLNGLAEVGVDPYLQQVAVKAAGIFNASGASIFLSDSSSTVFRVRARAGSQSTVPADATVTRGKGVAGHVVETRIPRVLGDLSQDAEFEGIEPRTRGDLSSSMVLPLIEPDGEVIGVLNLSRHAGAPPFLDQDLERATAVASHVALAASNARLMESLKDRIQEVHASGEKLQAVFDSVGSALLVFDPAGRVIDSNAFARDYLADDPDAWVKSTAIAPALNEALEAIKEHGRPFTTRAVDEERDQTWLIHGTPVSSGGAVLAITDVTDHEHALLEAERLRRLAEIGQMTAAVAHEIRNPLTGIRSAAQVVRDDPASADEFLGVIEEEVMKLNDLCEQFMAFARPMQLSLEQTDLAGLVRGVCKLHKEQFEEDGVELAIETGPDQPKMSLDRRRAEQVVHNLLRNARQACSEGGLVEVRIDGDRMVVRDDGAGMTEDQKARLFSPFFTTKPDGTGLGLSNVRRILDAHGAQIEFESALGEGSRFTVRFDRSLT